MKAESAKSRKELRIAALTGTRQGCGLRIANDAIGGFAWSHAAVLAIVLLLASASAALGQEDAFRKRAAAPPMSTEGPDGPIKRQMLDFQELVDKTLSEMFGPPFGVLQEAKATYLPGYGLVVHAEVNLYQMRTLMMFSSGYTAEDYKREKDEKLKRAAELRIRLREVLLQQAAKQPAAAPDDSIAIVVHLFNQRPVAGVPNQMVAQSKVQALRDAAAAKVSPAELEKLVPLREF